MNLTNAIRADLANQLMATAVKKHAAALGAEAEQINKELEDAHLAYLTEAMPEVPPARYAELIQQGILTCTSKGAEQVYYPSRRDDGSLTTTARDPGGVNLGTQASEAYSALHALGHRGWDKFFRYFSLAYHSYRKTASMEMTPKLSRALPEFNGARYVRLDALEPENQASYPEVRLNHTRRVAPLLDQAQKLAGRAAEVFLEGLRYREEVLSLLSSCRTDKQLRELFPEAADLLPKPEPKPQQLMPTELAEKVRKQLSEGIPV